MSYGFPKAWKFSGIGNAAKILVLMILSNMLSTPSTLPAAAAEPEKPPSAEATIPRTPGRPTAEEVESWREAISKNSTGEKRVLRRKLSRKTVARGSLQSAAPQALPAEDCSPTSGKRSGFFGRGDRQHISRRRIVRARHNRLERMRRGLPARGLPD